MKLIITCRRSSTTTTTTETDNSDTRSNTQPTTQTYTLSGNDLFGESNKVQL